MSEMDIAQLQNWVGRVEEKCEQIAPAHAARLAALFDVSAPLEGEVLPFLWHWAYFTPDAPQAQIGHDGHPRLGGFLPPIPLPRRMWAGGRLTFHAPLRVGETVKRKSEIISVTEKNGRQGRLVFVTLRHILSGAAGLAIEEEQDIVYREPAITRQPAPSEAIMQADWRDEFIPDTVTLFRYSALTFNAHRIHYDLPYAMNEENYPGLVVHGPLTATRLLAAYVLHTSHKPRTFSFRGRAPLFAGGVVQLCGRPSSAGHELWAEGPGGYLAMQASVLV